MKQDDADDTIYKVVINDEEQYSILVADGPNPAGWRDVVKRGVQVGMPYLHQRSVDRYETAQSPQENEHSRSCSGAFRCSFERQSS